LQLTGSLHVPVWQYDPPPHALPHAPQWALLVRVFTSHPLAGIASQLAQPVSQLSTWQVRATHTGTAWISPHSTPHPPQWLASPLAMLRSQPLAALPSQSPKSAPQAKPHEPAAQVAVAFEGAAQRRVQLPQVVGLARLASQPLAALESQSAKPALQAATAQAPAVQAGVPLATAQRVEQLPQCVASEPRSTSHPFEASPSQSAKPALQVNAHAPAAQDTAAWALGAHAIPQPPQCSTVARVSTSQPLAAMPSQSPRPGSQLPIPHAPAAQAPVALAGAQAVPQAPQWAALTRVSTHPPLQQVSPEAQCASVRQPVTQVLPMQCVDAGQCESVRQRTH